jgi:hypothetical protein
LVQTKVRVSASISISAKVIVKSYHPQFYNPDSMTPNFFLLTLCTQSVEKYRLSWNKKWPADVYVEELRRRNYQGIKWDYAVRGRTSVRVITLIRVANSNTNSKFNPNTSTNPNPTPNPNPNINRLGL